MSLFGQPNPVPSPFGTQGTSSASPFPSQPAQTGGLFGSPASSQPANSLFGSTFGSRPQQQTSLNPPQGGQTNSPFSLSAFGSLGTTQAQSTPTAGAAGGNFGLSQQPGSQPQQTSNPFQTQNNAAANQPFGSSFLAPPQIQQQSQNQQQPQNQFAQTQDANGQQPIGLVKTSQPAYFNSLLEKGKKRAHAADGGPGFGDLPSLQLGLEDIARKARELGGLGSQDKGAPTDGKASASR